ncbi:ROK family protein [Carnobacterium mobile]|uniref:ROK family protein n=1 Tax=Carnobacterium mobile TaxID=2750 RepID=UPI001865DCB6|nr:ROK family protein [Carnobacterium mobile]
MTLLAIDIGGTSIKHSIWENDELCYKDSIKTPTTWEEMKRSLIKIKETAEETFTIDGVAFSSPGAVNQEKRIIEGASALPYLHNFPVYDELEAVFNCPVSFENDANCAALAEIWKGAAKGLKNVLFVVVGTGIGGSVIVDGQIQHGKHLFGGEFGFMLMTENATFSDLATAVNMAARYAERKGCERGTFSGKEVFQLAEEGDLIAQEEVATFYTYLARGIYNLQYSFDPEIILIGGGISSKAGLVERLDEEFGKILQTVKIAPFKPIIKTCDFKNDANLIGAVFNYLQQEKR